MTIEPRSRRRRRKRITLRDDGSLFDVSERRPISQADLTEYLRDGGMFEARRQGSGRDCTYEVLQTMMAAGLVENAVPGLSGGPLSALGGMSGPGGLGSLGRLQGPGGLGQLGNLARLIGQQVPRDDRDLDDHDEPPRRSGRRRSGRGWNGWDEPPGRSGRQEFERGRDDWDEVEPD